MNEKTVEELMERRSAIAEEVEAEGADLDALEEEVRSINAELEARKHAEEKRSEIRAAVANGNGEIKEKFEEEKRTMDINEVRNSPAYIDAYAEYVKSGDDTELRNILTTTDASHGSESIPVPTFVYDIVKTAWDRDGITSRVRKAYLKGNLAVGFEASATDAVIHEEGDSAISVEDLVHYTVTLVPEYIMKTVQVSKEVYSLRGEAFLRYLYDELTYRIAKKAADALVAKIIACGTASTTNAPAVPVIATTATLGTVAAAMSELSDEAANPVIMMNKATWGKFKEVMAGGSYGYDAFEGLPVVFNNTITAYGAATTGVTYMIVGDLDHGTLINLPNGDGIEFIFDEVTLKKQGLIEILGQEYMGMGVVAPKAFAKVTMPA